MNAFAGALWLAALAYLLQFDGVPAKLVLGVGFFVGFFALALAYYLRARITVDATGIIYRGLLRSRRVRYEDIQRVNVLPGPVTVYAIRVGPRQLHFTSFFRGHRKLASLLVERARLAPST